MQSTVVLTVQFAGTVVLTVQNIYPNIHFKDPSTVLLHMLSI